MFHTTVRESYERIQFGSLKVRDRRGFFQHRRQTNCINRQGVRLTLTFNRRLRARVRGLPFRCKILGGDKKSSEARPLFSSASRADPTASAWSPMSLRFLWASAKHSRGGRFSYRARSEERRVGKECRSRWS